MLLKYVPIIVRPYTHIICPKHSCLYSSFLLLFLFAAKLDSISSLSSLNLRLRLHFPSEEFKSNWRPKKRGFSCLEMASDAGHRIIRLLDEKAAGEKAKNKDPGNLIW